MSTSAPRAARAGCACAAMLSLLACAPALDWRDVRPPGSALTLQMPCKPALQERSLPLAGTTVRLSLQACSADGQTWGIAQADVADPTRVGAALAELRASMEARLAAGPGEAQPLHVPGATPQPAAGLVRLEGRLPDGRAMQLQVAVFAHGTRVFQATAMGERLAPEATRTFFASIRVLP